MKRDYRAGPYTTHPTDSGGYADDKQWARGGFNIHSGDEFVIGVTVADVFSASENAAHARLFAASAEAIESLQALVEYCADLARLQDEYPECVTRAREVIAKALGE